MVEKEMYDMEDMINRYIYQVMKHLSSNNKKDIEAELRTLISDMLEDSAHGGQASLENLKAVLKELGSPYDLSEKYSENSHYLIGPKIYPTYIMVMKIVLYATLVGIVIAAALRTITVSDTVLYVSTGYWVTDIFNSLLISFAWVTILFVILERKGVRFKRQSDEWDPSTLPQTPTREIEIPIYKPIINIAFNVFVAVIFILSPQIIGAYYLYDSTKVIPIFNLEVLPRVIPLFIVIIGLSITKSIWEIIDRKITLRYAVFTAVSDVIQLLLLIIILMRFPIWNPDFITTQNTIFHISSNLSYNEQLSRMNIIIISLFVLIFLIELSVKFYKAIRYGNKFEIL
jgi:hypothetical protein